MHVEDIPADQDVLMSPLLHRAFMAGGCKPICHCCVKQLEIGTTFKLATVQKHVRPEGNVNSGINRFLPQFVKSKEVMLCGDCTVEKFNAMTEKATKAYEEYRKQGGGCYRINGKIVH